MCRRMVCVAVMASLLPSAVSAQTFSWQKHQAKVIETGELEWAPEPFVFKKGQSPRYIDFAGGDDARDGLTPATAWKHHPWDPAAEAIAKKGGGDTFIFKRGVIYRGRLKGSADGRPDLPIRFTSDPAWGAGQATLSGTQVVTGWRRGGDPRMPDAGDVWQARLDFAPRRVWIRHADGRLLRLTLARTPNWKPDNTDDLRAGWYQWEQPEWWTKKNVATVNGTRMHLGIDTKHLTGDPEQYKDAIVWTEYGIVMGSPFATRVESYDPAKKGVAFRGPWGGGDDGTIITGNRYFLEDKPQFLDEPGEFWFDKQGEGGTLYLRPPGDVDPNTVQIEAGRYSTLLEASKFTNLEISGLTFQGSNTFWDLTARPYVSPEIESSAIRLFGSGENVSIHHCRFDELTSGVRAKAEKDTDHIGGIEIADSVFENLDRGAIDLKDGARWGKKDGPFGSLENVAVLRNRFEKIGWRGGRDCHGHTIQIGFADLSEVAGNIVNQVGGSGIFVFGGKGSGELRDKPLSRVLIHHNKVSDSLLLTNDWGGIETWQGGPHYLWSNISYNPNGYWNWSFQNTKGKPADEVDWGAARQGFAYYFDGSFKNYVFNNIAAGKNNTTGSPLCNASAFQECVGFQNTFFNNTAYRFAVGLRRQSPRAGRDLWLGNVFDDISVWYFLASEPKEGAPKDANAFQFQDFRGSNYAIETNAYWGNVFFGQPRYFGVFEESGVPYRSLADFAGALERQKAMNATVGAVSSTQVLCDPANGDYRPNANPALDDKGARTFVPWGLYACVGEWNFTPNPKDPAEVTDESWYMTPYYAGREQNWQTPRHALRGAGISAVNYVDSPLRNWAKGAVTLDGKQYFTVAHPEMVKPYEYDAGGSRRVAQGLEIASPQIGTSNLLIEVCFRAQSATTDAILASKTTESDGYQLGLRNGSLEFILRSNGDLASVSFGKITYGEWHHVIAECDRAGKTLTLYLDGKQVSKGGPGFDGSKSLENTADFLVGKGLVGEMAFLRVCRGNLADARTSIDELYAWEFAGPQYQDFAGRPTSAKRVAGALARD